MKKHGSALGQGLLETEAVQAGETLTDPKAYPSGCRKFLLRNCLLIYRSVGWRTDHDHACSAG
jgi:hypothetical protein